MRHFAPRLLGRTGLALVAALVVLVLPDLTPLSEIVGALQVPVGVVMLICAIGKTLYDTLFFDRYRP